MKKKETRPFPFFSLTERIGYYTFGYFRPFILLCERKIGKNSDNSTKLIAFLKKSARLILMCLFFVGSLK